MKHVNPGAILITIALLLSLLASISVPNGRALDAVRSHFNGVATNVTAISVDEVRFGIWGYCGHFQQHDNWICENTGLAYAVQLVKYDDFTTIEVVGKSWTRGLVISAVATGFLFVATVLSYTAHDVFAALLAWLSALLTVIFMAINITLYLHVRVKMSQVSSYDTSYGPGFWLSLVVLILSVAGGFMVIIGHWKKDSNAKSYRFCDFFRRK